MPNDCHCCGACETRNHPPAWGPWLAIALAIAIVAIAPWLAWH